MVGPNDAAAYVSPTSVYVPVDWVPITPDEEALERPLRGLRAGTDGTITVIMAGSAGAERTLNFLAGETRWGIFTHVTGATAEDIEGAV